LSPKGKQRTVSADELPAWAHTYEFITAGYRNPSVHDTWDAALFSALQWHTESMNVHSHFWPGLGCFLFLAFQVPTESFQTASALGQASCLLSCLTSAAMIAPSFWIDPKSGQDYMLAVQYPEAQIQNLADLKAIPLHGAGLGASTRLDMVSNVSRFVSPTEVDHYQLRRITDIYVQTKTEDLGGVADAIDKAIAKNKAPAGLTVSLRGMVQGMRASFNSFGLGLCMSVVLLFLVITAQFQSFLDPVLILLALPPGLTGVLLTLWATGTTLNVMSLMGIVMMVGISVSDSILIVEFTKRLREEGMPIREAVATAARVRLRPVLMTSLATVIGLMPMALKLGEGSESYAPLARAICGGVSFSALLTVFVVPAAYVFVYGRKEAK
jgi:multidrug efflux pump subunit AcrB